jgi:hypothetical protein
MRRLLHALSVCFPLCAAALPPPYAGRLGVEASGHAFVDLVRENYRWEKPDGQGGWAAMSREDVDERGWPRKDCRWILDFRPCSEWTGQIDDPEGYRLDFSGIYKGSFRGSARLGVGYGSASVENQSYDPAVNVTTFDFRIPKPEPGQGLINLEFRDTRSSAGQPANSGISGFKLIRPGYPPGTTQLFAGDYLRCLKSASFSTIRFMCALSTNGNVEWGKDHTQTQSWSNRKLPDDAAMVPIGPLNKKDGWPWEFAVALCNEADMDMWINIPMAVDDDYVRQLALLLKSGLKPSLNIYIEHSNEVWNFGFLQYAWNKARAREEVAEKNARYNFDGVDNVEIWAQRRHAQRVRDIVGLFAEVFGEKEVNKRIRGVLAGCTADPGGFFVCGRLPGMLAYLQATGGEPADSLYAISTTAYYGSKSSGGEAGTETCTVGQILDDMGKGIEESKKERSAVVELARHYRLPGGFCAYESGPGIGCGETANLANRIRSIRDPRQAGLYKENFAGGFWDLGGNLAMQFTLWNPYNRYGAGALTDDVAKPDRNSLFQAVRELIGGPASP